MRLTDFLIIGAMKAGTTTLYRDLLENPSVFMPVSKEPGNFLKDDILTDRGQQEYARHFDDAGPDQVCGEASTDYTKLPDYPGVPERVDRVLGKRARVIYLVRDPVLRVVSQHRHELFSGRINCGIDEAVSRHPRYLNFSRYAMQIKPWLETLGPNRVRIVKFESYIEDRVSVIKSLSQFLGIEPFCETIDTEAAFNAADGKRMLRGPLARIQASHFYRRWLRRLFSASAKDFVRGFLPKPTALPDPPSEHTLRTIVEGLTPDMLEFASIMHRNEPLWDLEASATKIRQRSALHLKADVAQTG